jgi:hypothetical protein
MSMFAVGGHQCGMSVFTATPTYCCCNKCLSLIMSLKCAGVLGPEKGRFLELNVVALKRGVFVAESSLWQSNACGLVMPARTRRVAVRLAGGLADGLLFVWLGGELGWRRPVRARRSRRPTVCSIAACCVVRVHVAYAGRVDCLRCVELLPPQVGLLP